MLRPLAIAVILWATPVSAQRQAAADDRSPLLELGEGERIECTRVANLGSQHQSDGVAIAYALRFPQTRRAGEVGIGSTGATRTLRIEFDERSSLTHERYSAVLRFAANGRVELGHLRHDVLWARDGPPSRNYVLVPSRDHAHALALARLIAAHCHKAKT